MEQKKVDIEYIAKVAGVSRSTVSRVLTNKSNVKKDTKLRVQEVMRELNYHPSIMARGLATGKLNIVALIVSDIRNPFYSELVWSINDHLRQKGYLMTLYNSSQNTGENDRHLQSLFDYGFSGIIIADARNEASFTEHLGQSNCPIVLVNRELTLASGTSYDTVSVDNRQGGYLATMHLLKLGHRKISMLRGPKISTTSQARYEGYLQALSEYGLTPEPRHVYAGTLNMESGHEFARKIIAGSENPPSAVFVGGDLTSFGVIDECMKLGISIPQDLSIVGFDDVPMSQTRMIDLTTISHPYDIMGQLVAERIINRINGDNSPILKTVLMPTLKIRGSTALYHKS